MLPKDLPRDLKSGLTMLAGQLHSIGKMPDTDTMEPERTLERFTAVAAKAPRWHAARAVAFKEASEASRPCCVGQTSQRGVRPPHRPGPFQCVCCMEKNTVPWYYGPALHRRGLIGLLFGVAKGPAKQAGCHGVALARK